MLAHGLEMLAWISIKGRRLSACAAVIMLSACGDGHAPQEAPTLHSDSSLERCAGVRFPASGEKAIRSWSTAQSDAISTHPLVQQTLRQSFAPLFDGERMRLQLSNRYGQLAVTIDNLHIAQRDGSGPASVIADSGCPLHFGGESRITIGPGETVYSDPIAYPVRAFEQLSLSFYAPEPVLQMSRHVTGFESPHVSLPGDYTTAPGSEVFVSLPHEYADNFLLISALEVSGAEPTRTIVAVGDSITDGVGSYDPRDPDALPDQRYPDHLTRRLRAAGLPFNVVNAGISGNRLLSDGLIPHFGPKLLDRFEQDVLQVPGVTDIILMIGSNDIGIPPAPTPQELIAGYEVLIEQAQQRGIKVMLGTIPPARGSRSVRLPVGPLESLGILHGSAASYAAREEVNAWIRDNSLSDSIVDFDRCLEDPVSPGYLKPEYDSGDGLHPSAAGYAAMAACIDLALFR